MASASKKLCPVDKNLGNSLSRKFEAGMKAASISEVARALFVGGQILRLVVVVGAPVLGLALVRVGPPPLGFRRRDGALNRLWPGKLLLGASDFRETFEGSLSAVLTQMFAIICY